MELTSYNIVLCISTGGGVDQKISNLFRLGLKFELVVRRLVSVKSLVENFLDRITKRGHNECRYQRLVEGFLLTKPSDLGGLVVPLIDISIYLGTSIPKIGAFAVSTSCRSSLAIAATARSC